MIVTSHDVLWHCSKSDVFVMPVLSRLDGMALDVESRTYNKVQVSTERHSLNCAEHNPNLIALQLLTS